VSVKLILAAEAAIDQEEVEK